MQSKRPPWRRRRRPRESCAMSPRREDSQSPWRYISIRPSDGVYPAQLLQWLPGHKAAALVIYPIICTILCRNWNITTPKVMNTTIIRCTHIAPRSTIPQNTHARELVSSTTPWQVSSQCQVNTSVRVGYKYGSALPPVALLSSPIPSPAVRFHSIDLKPPWHPHHQEASIALSTTSWSSAPQET